MSHYAECPWPVCFLLLLHSPPPALPLLLYSPQPPASLQAPRPLPLMPLTRLPLPPRPPSLPTRNQMRSRSSPWRPLWPPPGGRPQTVPGESGRGTSWWGQRRPTHGSGPAHWPVAWTSGRTAGWCGRWSSSSGSTARTLAPGDSRGPAPGGSRGPAAAAAATEGPANREAGDAPPSLC